MVSEVWSGWAASERALALDTQVCGGGGRGPWRWIHRGGGRGARGGGWEGRGEGAAEGGGERGCSRGGRGERGQRGGEGRLLSETPACTRYEVDSVPGMERIWYHVWTRYGTMYGLDTVPRMD